MHVHKTFIQFPNDTFLDNAKICFDTSVKELKNNKNREDFNTLLLILDSMFFFDTSFSKENLFMMELLHDIQVALNFLFAGYYKASMQQLRSVLDLIVIYCNFAHPINTKGYESEIKMWDEILLNNKINTEKFEKWKIGKSKLNYKKYIKIFFSKELPSEYNKIFDLRGNYLRLYGELCKYIHNQGYKFSTIHLNKRFLSTFAKNGFETGIQYFIRVAIVSMKFTILSRVHNWQTPMEVLEDLTYPDIVTEGFFYSNVIKKIKKFLNNKEIEFYDQNKYDDDDFEIKSIY
jgi:hypothetical protein